MTDTTTTTGTTAPAENKPTEITVSYKGPDLKTLAIGGGLLAGAFHATNHALGALVPSAPAAAETAVTTAVSTLAV